MRKYHKIIMSLVVFLLSFITASELYQPYNSMVAHASGSQIKLTKMKETLYIGESFQLKLIGTDKKVKWVSSKPSVATVNNGKVTAIKSGKTTIKASCNSKNYTCKVTVKKKEIKIEENGEYTSKDEVALYIHIYQKLPKNYITKDEAKSLGWTGGSLDAFAPGKSIGGDYFGNYDKLLPEAEDRSYIECDIDTLGTDDRGAKRIVYSNDGLIYYTEDHYESFILLYNGC